MVRNISGWAAGITALGLALLSTGTSAAAAERNAEQRPPEQSLHLDTRFNHNRSYPVRGYVAPALPSGAVAARYRGSPYYFRGGSWYRPTRSGYVVVGAPLGLFVPFLPAFYTTVWFGGIPYYYANDTYYLWDAYQQGYVVTEPPQDPAAASTGPPDSDQLFIYPMNGQTEDQQSRDRYECHTWARQQSGFDPTQASGGVIASQVDARREQYRRAEQACLEPRGYSVH